MKRCRICGEIKAFGDFYRCARMRDGHFNECRACRLQASAVKRQANKEAALAADRAVRQRRSDEQQALLMEKLRLRRRKYKLKQKAHNAVHRAVDAGKLTRQPCEMCGAKADAHHDDYTRPLDVRWLCSLHHRRWHSQNVAYYPDQDVAS